MIKGLRKWKYLALLAGLLIAGVIEPSSGGLE